MVHHIFATDASSIEVVSGDAFTATGPDSLIVDPDAYLISDSNGNGAVLTGPWNVAINGAVGTFDFSGQALIINASGASDVSHITIGSTGDVFGGIAMDEGGTLVNKGNLSGRFTFSGSGGGNQSINNSGAIQGGQGCLSHFGTGDFTITNTGTIFGGEQTTIGQNGGDLTITNSGLIECRGQIGNFGAGALTLVNTGTITASNNSNLIMTINGAAGAHITNIGKFVGEVRLGDGADIFTDFKKVGKIVKNGTVTDEIDLRGGADHFNGGGNSETVRDGDGTDVINLAGGNDNFIAIKTTGLDNSDVDLVDGGKGIDTYDASEATNPVIVNLDTIAHAFDPDNPDAGSAPALTASGADISTDNIIKFENATGGAGADFLVGSNGANVLIGNAGNDTLIGLGGRDVLTGGADADTFLFLTLGDSGTTASTRDVITDFFQDTIDLSAIDANGSAAGDTAFNFIERAHFSGTRGELRESFSNGNTILAGDVNGDGKADFSIVLKGHFLLSEDGTDFIL